MEKEEGDECFRRKCKVLLYNMNPKFQLSSEFKIGTHEDGFTSKIGTHCSLSFLSFEL